MKLKSKKAFSNLELLISMVFIGTLLTSLAINYKTTYELRIKNLNSINSLSSFYKNIEKDYNLYRNISSDSDASSSWVSINVSPTCEILYIVKNNTGYIEKTLNCAGSLSDLKEPVNHMIFNDKYINDIYNYNGSSGVRPVLLNRTGRSTGEYEYDLYPINFTLN